MTANEIRALLRGLGQCGALVKGYVKPHTRKLASGKVVQVGGYTDKRTRNAHASAGGHKTPQPPITFDMPEAGPIVLRKPKPLTRREAYSNALRDRQDVIRDNASRRMRTPKLPPLPVPPKPEAPTGLQAEGLNGDYLGTWPHLDKEEAALELEDWGHKRGSYRFTTVELIRGLNKGIEAGTGTEHAAFTGGRAVVKEGLGSKKLKRRPKLGSGKRFEEIEEEAQASGARDPAAVAAAVGRKKYGAKKMAHLAAAGRKGK